jgi:hypothetical protein
LFLILPRLIVAFRNKLFFYGVGFQPHVHPPTWRTRVSLLVWVTPLDLSGMGGPTSSIRYRQHSSRVHVTTQALPLRQSRDTFGERIKLKTTQNSRSLKL